jgi:hypothetical protein
MRALPSRAPHIGGIGFAGYCEGRHIEHNFGKHGEAMIHRRVKPVRVVLIGWGIVAQRAHCAIRQNITANVGVSGLWCTHLDFPLIEIRKLASGLILLLHIQRGLPVEATIGRNDVLATRPAAF